MPLTVLVVPCFDEEQRLRRDAFLAFAQSWPGRFLLVDDGSTDRTFSILAGLQSSMPGSLEVLRLPQNAGKAEAVRSGVRRALQSAADHVGFWDADLATPLDTVRLFEDMLRERHALLGSRTSCRVLSEGDLMLFDDLLMAELIDQSRPDRLREDIQSPLEGPDEQGRYVQMPGPVRQCLEDLLVEQPGV